MKLLTTTILLFLLSCIFVLDTVHANPTRPPVPEDIWITNRDSEEAGDTYLLHIGRRSQPCKPDTPWSTLPLICPPLEAASIFRIPPHEQIDSASLNLYIQDTIDTEPHTFTLCAINSPTLEEITWDHLESADACIHFDLTFLKGWQEIPVPPALLDDHTFLSLAPGGQNMFWITTNSSVHPSLHPYFTFVPHNAFEGTIEESDESFTSDVLGLDTDIRFQDFSANTPSQKSSGKPPVSTLVPPPAQFPPSAISFLPKCTVNLYLWDGTYDITSCAIPSPLISSISADVATPGTTIPINITGTYPHYAYVTVNHYSCAKGSIFIPKSWFTCTGTLTKMTSHRITIYGRIHYTIPSSQTTGRSTISERILDTSFSLERYQGLPHIDITAQYFGHLKIGSTWIDISHTADEMKYRLPSIQTPPPSPSRPFTFPFSKAIGVTQWHGYTAYQQPHTGIDFGATEQKIYAPADGTVVYAGWDSTYGKCLSGGNILIIRHTDNSHTAYFHLKHFKTADGNTLAAGSSVKKGMLIGTTGNTGSWNCQPLGYHLHFETRTAREQSTHVNPVPLVDIDWNIIPTIGWKTYPGRLSGDNPHPGS
jgi:hypothetical protein